MDAKTFETILDAKLGNIENKLDGVKEDTGEMKKTLFGADGRGGINSEVAENSRLTQEHQKLLRGRSGSNGIVSDVQTSKRIFKILGGGTLTALIAKYWNMIFTPH